MVSARRLAEVFSTVVCEVVLLERAGSAPEGLSEKALRAKELRLAAAERMLYEGRHSLEAIGPLIDQIPALRLAVAARDRERMLLLAKLFASTLAQLHPTSGGGIE